MVKKIRREKYDLIINLQRFASSGIMTALGGAKETRGFSKNPLTIFFSKKYTHQIDPANPVHETSRNFSVVADLCEGIIHRPVLFPSEEDFKRVEKYKSAEYICLAPASIWFTKQLPFEKWVELIQQYHLKFPSHAIYILGGKADVALGDKLIHAVNCAKLNNLCGQLNFMQSAALMKDARAFGFGPLSDQSTIVESQLELACKPCGLHGYKSCPKGHFNCGTSIQIDIQ